MKTKIWVFWCFYDFRCIIFLAVSYRYKAWIVAKVEALESGMTVEAQAEEASASSAQAEPKPSAKKRPAQPATEPTANERAKQAKQTVVIEDEGEQWVRQKIAEAADAGKAGGAEYAAEAWAAEAADAGKAGGAEYAAEAWASEAWTSEDQLAFEPSWLVALQKYKVDGEAQLQLALLRDVDWHAAAEVVWKLTKKGAWDNDLKNPSGFVNRCCTTKLKQLHEQW